MVKVEREEGMDLNQGWSLKIYKRKKDEYRQRQARLLLPPSCVVFGEKSVAKAVKE